MPRSKRLGEAIFFFGRDSAPIITILIPVLLLLGYALITLHSGELDAGWKVDEGQRIAEGYFWRLLVARDFSNQDWFSRIEVRSHPPVNKYFFGAAIAVSGIEPPRSLALVDAYNNGAGAATLPAAFAKEYEPMRRPARLAAHGAMLLIAVIVFAVLLHLYGLVPALLSQVALFRHFLFGQLLFSARSDELEALLTMATVVPLAMLASQKRLWSQLALSGVAGVLAALARRCDQPVLLGRRRARAQRSLSLSRALADATQNRRSFLTPGQRPSGAAQVR